MCDEELPNGDEFYQCRKCEYDVCTGCFKRHASKSTGTTSKFGIVDSKLKPKDKDSKKEEAPKSILKNSPPRMPFGQDPRTLSAAEFQAQSFTAASAAAASSGAASSVGPPVPAPALAQVPPGLPTGVPPLPGDLPVPPDGMDPVMWKGMASMFDHKLRPVNDQLLALNASVVELQVNAVHTDTFNALGDRVVRLETGCIMEYDRVGRLETEVEQLRKQISNLNTTGGTDNAFKRIVFLGLPKADFDVRVGALKKYMATNFENIPFTECSVIFRGSYKDKNRTPTNTGYVEFASSDVRDYVLGIIATNKDKYKFEMKGKTCEIKRARTRAASDRNTQLTKVADMLKKMPDIDATDVEIQWVSGQRGVTLKGVYVFEQGPGNGLGGFTEGNEYLNDEMS